jgi:hypothetical protein
VLKNALKSENNYTQNGYYIFYHAQAWNIYWLEFLYTELWKIKYKKAFDNYTFMRFFPNNSCFENATLLQQEKLIRKELMQQGYHGSHNGSWRVFLNYALFGNSSNVGSSTIHYLLQNSNVSKPDINTEHIFNLFGLKNFYQENKKILDILEKEFLQLSEYGNLIQLAVPANHTKKHVYISSGPTSIKQNIINYTYNEAGDIIEIIKTQKRSTKNVIKICEALKTTPPLKKRTDKKEFVWVVTADTIQKALSDGVEIKSFNTADPEKFKNVTDQLTNMLTKKLAGHWMHPEMTPWECYKKHKNDL